jgi:hypothetical protein
MARRIEAAAARFKAHWERDCPAAEIPDAYVAMEWPPAALDPDLLALLRAVACGDDGAVAGLAEWLEERGHPRAAAIRELTRLEAVVRETQTGVNEVSRSLDFILDGKRCGGSGIEPASAGNTDDSLAQHVRELRRRHQKEEVLQRLGLTHDNANALWQYFGLGPPPCPMSARCARKARELQQAGGNVGDALPGDTFPGGKHVQEIARREGVRAQTVRNRIIQALHRLAVPDPHGR